jgi:hypothetical protein
VLQLAEHNTYEIEDMLTDPLNICLDWMYDVVEDILLAGPWRL